MAQSGNPVGELHCVSDIPTEKCEGSRGLCDDGVGLRMTETEKYKLGLTVTHFGLLSHSPGTHRICHTERKILEKISNLGCSGRQDDREFTDRPHHPPPNRKTAKDGPSSPPPLPPAYILTIHFSFLICLEIANLIFTQANICSGET